MNICVGTKFKTKKDAEDNCPDYCIVRYCRQCKAWHVIQKLGAK